MNYAREKRTSGARTSEVARVTTETGGGAKTLAEKLGIEPGHLVQEIGWDDDCDEQLRESIADVLDNEMVDEDFDDVVDVVLLWWREFDGDLVDALMDAIAPLADHGVIWLFTPKPGRPGHVEPFDIADSAPTAGLQSTSTVSASKDWQGTRLVAPRAGRK